MSGQPEKYNPFCSQNGIKYRSICGKCNIFNILLLAKYDKALEDLVTQLKQVLINDPYCKNKILKIRVNALAKSICGHFLAMKDGYDDQCDVDKKLRVFVQDENELPPEKMSLLMRYYPFSTTFFIRDSVVINAFYKSDIPQGIINVMSSFPLSFVLCDSGTDCGLIDLFKYCSCDISEETLIDFDFTSAYFPGTEEIRHPKWPCNISKDQYGISCVICSKYAAEESIFAKRNVSEIHKRLKDSQAKNMK